MWWLAPLCTLQVFDVTVAVVTSHDTGFNNVFVEKGGDEDEGEEGGGVGGVEGDLYTAADIRLIMIITIITIILIILSYW